MKAVDICSELINSRVFKDSTVTMLFTHVDTFINKQDKKPFQKFFNDYNINEQIRNSNDAAYYFSKYICKLIERNVTKGGRIYHHQMRTLDYQNVKCIMDYLQHIGAHVVLQHYDCFDF